MEKNDSKPILIKEFLSSPAYAMVKKGATKNMGNYESVRVEVGVSVPCYLEELDRVIKDASKFVDVELEREMKEIVDMD